MMLCVCCCLEMESGASSEVQLPWLSLRDTHTLKHLWLHRFRSASPPIPLHRAVTWSLAMQEGLIYSLSAVIHEIFIFWGHREIDSVLSQSV